MPFAGSINLEYRWGWDHRKRALTEDQVRLIRSGNKHTDAIYAKQFGMRPLSIRNVRNGHRYRDVKKENDK